jgi:methylglutaconyl-CoA hydratase
VNAQGEGDPVAHVVHRDVDGPVLTLTLDSPANRNALSRQLVEELADGLAQGSSDPSIRLIVLTGTGSVFCSGADLQERLHPPVGAAKAGLPEVLTAIVEADKPVLARVNGHVRAGGMGLVAACDLAVAPSTATFAFSEVRVGVAPAMIAVPAMRVMKPRDLVRYTLTGEVLDAAAAQRAGLLTATVEADQLDDWVSTTREALLQCAPSAVGATKGLLRTLRGQAWAPSLAEAERLSAELFASADATEGMTAFLEKRVASWAVGT